MAYWLEDLPMHARRNRRAAAAAFALVVAGVYQPALVSAQIEVEVLTTGTQAGTANTTAAQSVDASADEAARKIVPAPGTVLQSTEDSSLQGGAGAVVKAPSLTLANDQLVLQEGETTETVAVKSGAELLKMLGLQKKAAPAEGGLEMEEDQANSLFDVTAVKRLKGEDPTVVYRVVIEDKPLPDPMIVPWIRQAKLLQERFDKAVTMLAENRLDEGRQEMLAIITDFPDTDYALQAREILKKLDDLNKADTPAPVIQQKEETTVTVELSPNVAIGTVIVDPGDPSGNRAMIGGRAYKVGDQIVGEVGHRVVSISERVVQIEVEQSGIKQMFDVPVRPTGTNN